MPSTKLLEWIIGAGVVIALSPLLGISWLPTNFVFLGIIILLIGTFAFSFKNFQNSSSGVHFSNTF